jgi:lipopolysaccharide export system protein LptA
MTRRFGHWREAVAALGFLMALGWTAAAQQAAHGAAAAAPGPGAPGPSPLFSQNSDQPIKIESTSLEVRDKEHQATFIGNVRVIQGDTTLKCKTLVVFYDQSASGAPATPPPAAGKSNSSGQQIKRLEAKGGVVIVQKEQTATGDNGVFDMKTNTATLIGNVIVTQGENVVKGDRLVVDMTTGVSRVESDKASKGGVKMLIKPNSPPPGQPGSTAKDAKPSAPLKIN